MYGLIYIWIGALISVMLLLRKVVIVSTVLTDNAASFVNQTADRLHVRKLVGRPNGTAGAAALGDASRSSIDEVPVSQAGVNNSRSHIAQIGSKVIGGTGAVEASHDNIVLTFERGQLFLDPDEALFMNNTDIAGAMPSSFSWNIWYED